LVDDSKGYLDDDLDRIDIGLETGRVGFGATGGGLGGSQCTDCFDISVKVGFGDFISGFRGLAGTGDGVRALVGKGDAERCGPGDLLEADVADLLAGGRLRVCGDAAFCSNIPIKDGVGGIDVVSNGWSKLSLEELPLLIDGDLGPRPDGLSA
jgi:hypothetical protein